MARQDIRVEELTQKVLRGEIVLPEMQRRFVWRDKDVRNLLDSLYRDYPSGTILAWETDEELPTHSLSVTSSESQSVSATKYLLLDGQQRTTSLTAVINGEDIKVRNYTRPIRILFNLEHPDELYPEEFVDEVEDEDSSDIATDDTETKRDLQAELANSTFVIYTKALASKPEWVDVSDIFQKDNMTILREVGITDFGDPRIEKYSARLDKVRDIKKYQYNMEVISKDKTYQEATDIFVRVNNGGIRLRGSDLALAQVTSKWRGFMKISEDFADSFRNKSDGEYIANSNLLVRTMVVFATRQSRFNTVGKLNKAQLEAAFEKAKDGLTYAVEFLEKNAYVDSLYRLSSPLLVVPIAVYWSLKGGEALSETERKTLLKWFYYAHMRGHYGMGSSESILDADLKTLFDTQDLDKLFDRLVNHVKKLNVDSRDIEAKGINSPFFAMIYFVLRANSVHDWWNSLELSGNHNANEHKIQYHHVIPHARIKDIYPKENVNEIANMVFLSGKGNRKISDKLPHIYLRDIDESRLAEHLVPTYQAPYDENGDNTPLWRVENFFDFLEYRRGKIVEAINTFLAKFE